MIHGAQNLHSHTYLSDGKMTHLETLEIAAKSGCSVVAFSDHDTLMPADVFHTLQTTPHETAWVSGIELSTNNGHVVGLFVDPTNRALMEHCRSLRESRVRNAQDVVTNFSKLGFKITIEECLAKAADGAVGKPHIVAALLSHPENVAILEGYIEKFRAAVVAGHSLASEYERAINDTRRMAAFVYPIFLYKDAFIPGVYGEQGDAPSPAESAELIRAAGGVALLAHWHLGWGKQTPEELEALLRDKVIDGVETVWGMHDLTAPSDAGLLESRRIASELVERYHALPSASVDAHSVLGYTNFAKDEILAQETLGMAEKIIERSGVSTTWSTLGDRV